MAEPALTIAADGGVTAPDTVRSKLELGDSYGMRNASSLGKEWYEHSEGYCSYLKGKTEKEAADIPADGSDADLAALCTISIDACKRPQGMRLRMRHYKLNGKSDRHREVAVFLRLRGRPVAPPLGELSPKVTERASPSPESRRAAISRPFVRAILSPRLYISVSVLALSVSLRSPALP